MLFSAAALGSDAWLEFAAYVGEPEQGCHDLNAFTAGVIASALRVQYVHLEPSKGATFWGD